MSSFLAEFTNICEQCIDEDTGLIFDDKDCGNKTFLLFISCFECSCCERHQINKPNIWQPYVFNGIIISNNNRRCECSCRHVARWICRKHPNANN